MGKVSEYMEQAYGSRLESIDGIVVINAAAPVVAMQNDPNRFAWVIVNMGANIAYLAFESAVAALFGMQIAANGGTMSMNARDDGEIVTRQLFALGAGASTLFIVQTRAIQ